MEAEHQDDTPLVDEDQIVPQVREKHVSLADNNKLQEWTIAEIAAADTTDHDDNESMEFTVDPSAAAAAATLFTNEVLASEPVEEDAIVPRAKPTPIVAVDLEAALQSRRLIAGSTESANMNSEVVVVAVTSNQAFAAAPSTDTSGSSGGGGGGEVVEATVVADRRRPARQDWLDGLAASRLNADDFAWIAVDDDDVELPPTSSTSGGDSYSLGDEEMILVEHAVEPVFRAAPPPPVDEEIITAHKRPKVECSVEFGRLSTTTSSAVEDGGKQQQQQHEVEEESIGAVRVSVKRLDEMLASSKIELEPVSVAGDLSWRTSSSKMPRSADDDESPPLTPPVDENAPAAALDYPISKASTPLEPVVEEEAIVPEAKKTAVAFEPNFDAMMFGSDEEFEQTESRPHHREMAVDVPPGMEAAGLRVDAAAKSPKAEEVVVVPAPEINGGTPQKSSSGGGIFGFFKRKPKNGGAAAAAKDDSAAANDDDNYRRKSNSLDKTRDKGDPEAVAAAISPATGGTFPMEAKKEKSNGGGNGRFRIGGFNFGGKAKAKDKAKEKENDKTGVPVAVDEKPFGADNDDDGGDSDAKKTAGSGAGAKSPSKTNIRIFEIMASNGATVESPAAPVAAPVAQQQQQPSADTTVFCPVGVPVKAAAHVECDVSSQMEPPPAVGHPREVLPSSLCGGVSVTAAGSPTTTIPPPSKHAVVHPNVAAISAAVQSADSPPQTAPLPPYMVAVAIDFGTTFSGYAFSFTHEGVDGGGGSRGSPDGGGGGPSVHMMGKWEGGDPGVVNQKTPSTLLLTPDGRFHSFGFTARNFYHDLTPDDADSWLYFDKFKMTLYNATECNADTKIRAANGKSFSAFRAVAMTLNFFRQHAIQELNTQCATRIMDDDIRWVITVPAIWNAHAKQFMRMAAYEAGIASTEKPDQLLIALEPEAASIHIRRLRMHQLVPDRPVRRPLSIRQDGDILDSVDLQRVATKFNQRKTRYMVVDCGGGTVDITVHELDAVTAKLQELHKASGGPHGSCGIDSEFEKLLDAIFGAEPMRLFRRRYPAGWICLMMAFESRKRAANPNKSTPLNISLPFTFIDFYHKHVGLTVEAAIGKYGDKDIRWSSQGMLRMTQDAMKKLFQPTLDSIWETVTSVLEHPRLKDVHYIFLVGGLSESPLLQQDVRNRCGAKAQVLVPQEASLAVLKGAVCFGLDQTVVSARRSRYTYGAAVLKRFVRGRHPESKLLRRAGGDWCRDVFDAYAVVDQVVRVGDVVVRRYAPASASQTYITIAIYCSPHPTPVFTTDEGVTKCATIRLDLSSVANVDRQRQATRVIETRMTFADTEIKITAVDVTTGQHVNASMDFFNV